MLGMQSPAEKLRNHTTTTIIQTGTQLASGTSVSSDGARRPRVFLLYSMVASILWIGFVSRNARLEISLRTGKVITDGVHDGGCALIGIYLVAAVYKNDVRPHLNSKYPIANTAATLSNVGVDAKMPRLLVGRDR